MSTDNYGNGSIRELVDQKLRQLRWAKSQWDSIRSTLNLGDRDFVIIFPSKNREYNLYGMKYLDTFLQRQNGGQAVIITNDSFVKNFVELYSDNVKKILCVEERQLNNLVNLYQLYKFEPNLVIISLDKPFCRNASGLVGVKNITIEQMIAIGIYSIIPFRPLKGKEKII